MFRCPHCDCELEVITVGADAEAKAAIEEAKAADAAAIANRQPWEEAGPKRDNYATAHAAGLIEARLRSERSEPRRSERRAERLANLIGQSEIPIGDAE
jgi:uncharacterized Zn finger protein (UPF0148 family)